MNEKLGKLTITFSDNHSFTTENVVKFIPEADTQWVEFIDNYTQMSMLVQIEKILYIRWEPNEEKNTT